MESARYFERLAVAFVRGRLGELPGLSGEAALAEGLQRGLRLQKFKRTAGLSRVQRVLGILRGFQPESLLDIGSGRGAFLWPLLDAFPDLPVVAIDRSPRRIGDITAVASGGVGNLFGVLADAQRLPFRDASHDIVTLLEVLEHLPSPQAAAREAVRVARRAVVASVPSRSDSNPEHIHLFDASHIETLFVHAGARRVKVDFVLNHLIAVAAVER